MTQFYKSTASTQGHSFYYNLDESYEIKEFSHDFGAFDPRTREWYISALPVDDLIYSSIYEHFVMKDMTLSAAKRIYAEDTVKGVVGVHLTLSKINEFLKEITDNNHATVFIINNLSGKLIASTNESPSYIEVDDTSIRAITLSEISNPVVLPTYEQQMVSETLKDANDESVRVSSTAYINRSVDWQIITIIPENQYSGYLSMGAQIFAAITILLLIVGILIWSRITKVVLSPIDDLVKSTVQFSRGNHRFKVKESNIVEVNRLSDAFMEMTEKINENILSLNLVNKEYIEAKRKAEEANKSKSQFLANMSHEIRTPMNGIIALSDILIQEELNDNHREMLKVINESGKTLLQVINDILDISKIESGKMSCEPSVVELMPILKQNTLVFSNLANQKELDFRWQFSDTLPQFVFTDPNKLNQILYNLLGNAVKFTDYGDIKLAVSASPIDKKDFYLIITVEDTGIGISTEDIDSVFDIFVQSDLSKDKRNSGTGLGLAIVKELVQLLGGDIKVESVLGEGTKFTAALKMSYATETLREESVKDVEGVVQDSSPRILLVDDDQTSHFVINVIADKFNWRLKCASTGEEALRILEKERFSIVLMDVQMPVMNGIKVTQEIRKREAGRAERSVIVGMSAYAMENEVNEALSSGMDAYITKPINYNDLKKLVEKYSNA